MIKLQKGDYFKIKGLRASEFEQLVGLLVYSGAKLADLTFEDGAGDNFLGWDKEGDVWTENRAEWFGGRLLDPWNFLDPPVRQCPHCGAALSIPAAVTINVDNYGGTKLTRLECCGKGVLVSRVNQYRILPFPGGRPVDDWGKDLK